MLDAKVVDNKAECDVTGRVAEEAGGFCLKKLEELRCLTRWSLDALPAFFRPYIDLLIAKQQKDFPEESARMKSIMPSWERTEGGQVSV
jgi:hypothetical protein